MTLDKALKFPIYLSMNLMLISPSGDFPNLEFSSQTDGCLIDDESQTNISIMNSIVEEPSTLSHSDQSSFESAISWNSKLFGISQKWTWLWVNNHRRTRLVDVECKLIIVPNHNKELLWLNLDNGANIVMRSWKTVLHSLYLKKKYTSCLFYICYNDNYSVNSYFQPFLLFWRNSSFHKTIHIPFFWLSFSNLVILNSHFLFYFCFYVLGAHL